ncbi:MAG: M36 family metallopeptidase, partial [Chloroflexota bacterium]
AAVTNLFYWNNLNHDIFYLYGFDEASGNFQVNNYGRGGVGGDDVRAEAQDGADVGNRNNANFFTPADGSRPRMQMYLWNTTTPERDGDFSSMIITHEYGHGVSIRLTGGPGTVSCLSNQEQMGEGWSDYLGLILTMHPDDLPETSRGVGTYALGQTPDGQGIRPAPYSTDFALNNFTYANLPAMAVPHGVGFVWATMIWDMTWELVEKHGFNPDIYGDWTSGGNNLALQLVMDGMKLQPCSPGFVDGRDAILLADQALTGGQNQCEIWSAFADRGLGVSASQGSSGSSNDGTPAFDMPASCMFVEVLPAMQSACVGDLVAYDVSVGAAFEAPVTLSVAGLPANTSASFDPNPVVSVPDTSEMSVMTTAASPAGVYDLTISGVDASQTFTDTAGLAIFEDVPAPVALQNPANNAIGVDFRPEFVWSELVGADSYFLEVATDMNFTNLVYTATVASNMHQPTSSLAAGVTHYWRVTTSNACGQGAATAPYQFTVSLTSFACNMAPVDFEAGIPGDWTVTNDSASGLGIEWVTTADAACIISNRTNGGGEAACADSDAAGSGSPAYDTSLVSPLFALPYAEASWEMDAYYRDLNAGSNDTLAFDIWNGVTWDNLLTWNENHTTGEFVSLDLAAYVGQSDLQIRVRYAGNGWDWYAQVDNVGLNCDGAIYGVDVGGSEPITAVPTTTISHTVAVTNTSITESDTFDLSLVGHNWPTSHSIPGMLSLDAGESASFTVEVTVPVDALAGESDTAIFRATSQGDPQQTASVDLTTSAAAVFELSLTALETELSGEVGTPVTYTLTLTNLGNSSDTFDFVLSGYSWTTDVDPVSVTLDPGQSGQLWVTVLVPEDAAGGSSDAVTVTATSQGDPAQSEALTLTTTAISSETYLYLPLITGN